MNEINTIKKTLTINEIVDLENDHPGFAELLSVFPNHFGINLCCIENVTFEAEDDEYGQLKSVHINLKPTHDEEDYKSIKYNGGPFPWLKRNENGEIIWGNIVKTDNTIDREEDNKKVEWVVTDNVNTDFYNQPQETNEERIKQAKQQLIDSLNEFKVNGMTVDSETCVNDLIELIDSKQMWFAEVLENWLKETYIEIIKNYVDNEINKLID